MKIFEFNWDKISGEKDWWCDHDLESAKENYIRFTGCGDLQGCEISELEEQELNGTYLLDINESEPYDSDEEYNEDDYSCGYKIISTFKEYLETAKTPDMVATTDF